MTKQSKGFGGRLALVTGAGSGIGKATALAFASAGADIVAVDIDGQAAARTAEEAEKSGVTAHSAQVDVSDAGAMEDLAKSVATQYGVPDVVVNNAGIAVAGPFLDTSLTDWQRIMDVNLWGVIHGCRLFGRQMVGREQGGHIVNIASAAAVQPSKSLSAYSTTKAAVLMLSECLRAELAGHDIGVTAVCPGFVSTNLSRTARFVGQSDAEQERTRQRTARFFKLRHYPPERVARHILAAVSANKPVLTLTAEGKFAYALAHIAPGGKRALARLGQPL
jgi:NAD(P)-dependent dehydrogenase (short-subunit alcohol dehydrogenase family)